MYLSRVELNMRSRDVIYALGSCQKMHALVMKGFEKTEDSSPRQALGVLYRMEETNRGVVLYVQSKVEPIWERVGEPIREFSVKEVSKILDTFKEGNVYGYSLIAHAFKKIDRKRITLKTVEERANWLIRKGEQNGFELLSIHEEDQVSTKGIKDKNEVGFFGTKFAGVLRVVDEEKFKRAYAEGIGVGKSYGMGMLMLYRV